MFTTQVTRLLRGYYIRVHDTQCLRHKLLDYVEDITSVSMTDNVYDIQCLRHKLLDYHNLGTSVVNIVCHGHKCNILFITVELLN